MIITRKWAMPNANTFSIPPIKDFVEKYTKGADVVVDPFARDSCLATVSNDLNPSTSAQYHMRAEDFLDMLFVDGVVADVVLLDAPYSPRQISECYSSAGMKATMKDTQNARFMKEVKDRAARILRPRGFVLSFGWNSSGMGQARGFSMEEILLVCHGGAHNDTICVAEKAPERS